MVARGLERVTIGGNEYWLSPTSNPGDTRTATALLLSIYDEYVIAYRDRSALGGQRYVERLLSMGNALTSVLIIDGQVAGTWRKTSRPGKVEVATSAFRRLRPRERAAVRTAVAAYGDFMQTPTVWNEIS